MTKETIMKLLYNILILMLIMQYFASWELFFYKLEIEIFNPKKQITDDSHQIAYASSSISCHKWHYKMFQTFCNLWIFQFVKI